MCYAVYLGTDVEMKTSKFDEKNPGFYVENINDGNHGEVKRQFTKKYVYYLGSHECCGCGFSFDEQYDDAVKINSSKQDILRFNELLSYALGISAECEIFLCWDGDQGKSPEVANIVGIEIFSNGNWVKDKPTFYKVRTK